MPFKIINIFVGSNIGIRCKYVAYTTSYLSFYCQGFVLLVRAIPSTYMEHPFLSHECPCPCDLIDTQKYDKLCDWIFKLKMMVAVIVNCACLATPCNYLLMNFELLIVSSTSTYVELMLSTLGLEGWFTP